MQRSKIDKLVSSLGLVIALVLLLSSFGLLFAHNFVHQQVYNQLSAQKISFPKTSDAGFKALPSDDQAAIKPYAGQQLTTGAQAEVFADHYIAVHLNNIGGGKTYSELSAQSQADPSNTALAAKVSTVFQGEMLRGTLLNAYAFDTMATVAGLAAVGAFIGTIVFVILALLGFAHAKKASPRRRK